MRFKVVHIVIAVILHPGPSTAAMIYRLNIIVWTIPITINQQRIDHRVSMGLRNWIIFFLWDTSVISSSLTNIHHLTSQVSFEIPLTLHHPL
jgi:hypothetical protein